MHNSHSCLTLLQTDKLTTLFSVCFSNRLSGFVATCIYNVTTWRPTRPLFWYWCYQIGRVLSSVVWWLIRTSLCNEWRKYCKCFNNRTAVSCKTMIQFECRVSNRMIYMKIVPSWPANFCMKFPLPGECSHSFLLFVSYWKDWRVNVWTELASHAPILLILCDRPQQTFSY